MSDKEIEEAVAFCSNPKNGCNKECPCFLYENPSHCDEIDYINRLKSAKQLVETQLKELLSALYQKTDSEQGFTLYRKDIVELAKDYGIKEEELK